MMVHSWDAAKDDAEWQAWLAQGRDFGTLTANGAGGGFPEVVPAHFFFDDDGRLIIHLARPNPVWKAIATNPSVAFSVIDDYAFIPGTWRLRAGAPADSGVPTSYYSAVIFNGTASIVSDAGEKAALLAEQMGRFQPEGGYGPISADEGPYARMLPAIQFAAIEVAQVLAKFKFDDDKDPEFQQRIIRRLESRGRHLDRSAQAQLERRMSTRLADVPESGSAVGPDTTALQA